MQPLRKNIATITVFVKIHRIGEKENAVPFQRITAPLLKWQIVLVATLAGCLLLFVLFDSTLEGFSLGCLAAGCLYAITRFWTKAERAAAYFEKRHQITAESCHALPYALLAFDADGQCQFTNALAQRLFPGAEITSFHDFLEHFSEHRKMLEALKSFAQELPNGGLRHFDVPMALQNKDLVWWRVTAAPLMDLAGGTLWSFADLTPASQYLDTPEANPIFLLELLHSTTVGYFTINSAGTVAFCNAAFAQWLGMKKAEVVGALCCELFTKETEMCLPTVDGLGRFERSPVASMVLKGREEDHPVLIQQIFVREKWRTYSALSALAADGANISFQAHNDRIETLMHMTAQAPIGILTLDSQGFIGACNDALCRLSGQDKKRIVGKNIFECLDQSSCAAVKERLHKIPLFSEDVLEIAFIDRGPHTALCSIGVLPASSDQETELHSIVMYVIDVARHKHLEERLTQSQKMQAVGQLAGGIAHDFNNLLTAMIGYCDLLLGRYSPNEQPFADVMQIKQNANRAARLVRQLLAFSRQQELQQRVLDVTDVLSDLSALLRRLLGGTVDLSIIHGSNLGCVRADPVQLEQVIMNIAINARDAMPNGGSITIKTYDQETTQQMAIEKDLMPPGRYTVIDICDTGMGIATKDLPHIFDPFYSTKPKGAGTGLGLSTAHGIVKQTGGFIKVTSTKEKGTIFSVFLPVCQEAREETGPPLPVKTFVPWRNLTGSGQILFVDDEDSIRLLAARALREKGYTVIEAENGQEALAYLRKHPAIPLDLLITDVIMPHIDGPELVQKVHENYPHLKTIFISGYTGDCALKNVVQNGNVHFLPKPFDVKDLSTKVKEVLG